MQGASGKYELWRRIALLLGIIIGFAMLFFVAPDMVTITAVDWEQEQAEELESIGGYLSEEKRRLNQLPLVDYIREKTDKNVTLVDDTKWFSFFTDVQLASSGQYDRSSYANRVSDEDKDAFWEPSGSVEVFFKSDEIPLVQWGLIPEDGDKHYITTTIDGQMLYFQLGYQDYNTSISAMSGPYRVAPDWLFHPYRNIGIAVLIIGLTAYIVLPRRKKDPDDISYSTGSMLAGDLVALILLVAFYGAPFLINGGTTQALTGMWGISVLMWGLALFSGLLLYYNAWYASFRIILTVEALSLVTFRGIRKFRFQEMEEVNLVSLRNPGWFRNLFLIIAFFSLAGGNASTQPAGSALLTETAAYGGLEIQGSSGKPCYIWFTNQNGGVIIRNFEKVIKTIENSGRHVNRQAQTMEGFSMFM